MKLLATLRAPVPSRRLTRSEAYGLVERQATKLLLRSGVTHGPVPSEIISGLPYVQVSLRRLPSSGASRWIKPRWRILLNSLEPAVRQRFSLAHEFAHIVHHPYLHQAFGPLDTALARAEHERLCDYFAACLLMPRPWIKRDWASGVQDIVALAERYEVSPQAMQVRIMQLGLVDPYARHSEMDNDYFRSLPASPLGLAA